MTEETKTDADLPGLLRELADRFEEHDRLGTNRGHFEVVVARGLTNALRGVVEILEGAPSTVAAVLAGVVTDYLGARMPVRIVQQPVMQQPAPPPGPVPTGVPGQFTSQQHNVTPAGGNPAAMQGHGIATGAHGHMAGARHVAPHVQVISERQVIPQPQQPQPQQWVDQNGQPVPPPNGQYPPR